MKTHYLKIHSGWFYGAGSPKVYNWTKDGYDQAGVGINAGLLINNDRLEIEIDKKVYFLDCRQAKEFYKRYNSMRNQKGTMLVVISKTLLTYAYAIEQINQ